MSGIVPTFVQCHDGYKTNIGLRYVEGVDELQSMPTSDTYLDVAHASSVHSGTAQSLDGVTWDASEVSEVCRHRRYVTRSSSIKDEW